jgi:hypothetical protein
MEIIEWIMNGFSNYVNSQINEINYTVTHIDSLGYTLFFLWIFIRIYRKITFNE